MGSSFFNQNYSGQKQNIGQIDVNKLQRTRTFIRFAAYFGIFISFFMFFAYLYFLLSYNNNSSTIANQQGIFIKTYSDLGGVPMILFIGVTWMFVKSLICNMGIIKYSKASDLELIANKWVLAVLSLSVGGLFTPYLLTRLPNIDIKATQNARGIIVKYFGSSIMLGALACLIGLGAFYLTMPSEGRIWEDNSKQIFLTVIGILSGISILCLITVPPFFRETAHQNLAAGSKGKFFYRFVATAFTIIATIELIFLIISAVLSVIASILELFGSTRQNGFAIAFGFLRVMLRIAYAAWLISIVSEVIRGLWVKGGNDMHFKVHQKSQNLQNQFNNQKK